MPKQTLIPILANKNDFWKNQESLNLSKISIELSKLKVEKKVFALFLNLYLIKK